MKIGIIGCGNISGIYLKNAARLEAIELAGCADLVEERARQAAEEHGCAAMSVDELLADDSIELVLNLTVPKAHHDVALRAVRAGKHVYNEKPLTIEVEDARNLLAEAESQGVRVGCAPDTFLGAGLQTCREIIDSGRIGKPVSATAFMMCHGHEHWHPDPEFYYEVGGGPMLDMGPYYVTALVSLLGPVRRLTGSSTIGLAERTIESEKKKGKTIEVEADTHIAGVLDFAGGAVGTIITSFDVWGHNCPKLEIHGTKGSLSCPDPNTFGGPVQIREGRGDWQDVEITRPYAENSRGLGVADLAAAARSDRAHRCSGALAGHVLEIMTGIARASREGRHVEFAADIDRPEALPADLAEGEVPA
jgi:predicted dehydrogenase